MLAIDRASDFGQFRAALAELAVARAHLRLRRPPAATSARSRPGTTRRSGTATRGCPCREPEPTTWPASSRTRRSRRCTTRPRTSSRRRTSAPSAPPTRTTSGRRRIFFDPGYRADAEYAYLRAHRSMTPSDFAALQDILSDQLAAAILPKLRAALRGGAADTGSAAVPPGAGLVEQADGRHLGRRGHLVDVLDRLPVGRIPALVDCGEGAGIWMPPDCRSAPASSAWTRISRRGRCTTSTTRRLPRLVQGGVRP